MRIDQGCQGFDRDGLFTFLLTLLIIGGTLGLSLLVFYLHAWWIARSTLCNMPSGSCLLVFGKRLKQGSVDADYRLRLDRTAEFLAHDPQLRVILLGGAPMHEQISEAKAGLDYLKAKGAVSPDHIQLEERSRNTLENLRQARKILERENCADLILITNRYHLARSRMIANSLGLQHLLCPAEAAFSFTAPVLGKLVFEAFYMLWFNTGKTWARMIGSRRMLQRITWDLTRCAAGNKYNYRAELTSLPIVTTTNKTLLLSLDDRRPYVLSGEKKPDFVGLQRGGFGNPFDVTTASGKPMTDDIATSIAASLELSGYTVKIAENSPDTSKLTELAKTHNAFRIIRLQVFEWKSDIYMSIGLHYDWHLAVSDAEGNLLAENAMKGNVVRMSDRAKLLVVDDEPERCEMLTEYFDTQGFVTRAVGSVSEARQFLERWIPNLAILD